MKAFSNVSPAPFLLAGLTVVLGVVFWLRIGPGQNNPTTYAKMNGKTLTIAQEKEEVSETNISKASATTIQANSLKDAKVEPLQPVKARSHRRKRPRRSIKQSGSAASIPTISTTVDDDPSSKDAISKYRWQVIADGFENDASKYPMDMSAQEDGIMLSLLGLERLKQMFVLKVSVFNGTESDFYVKGFSVQEGSSQLGSQSDFRLLVEPKKTREGYVVFAKPKPGAKVRIKLKEDGGKERNIETSIPYLF